MCVPSALVNIIEFTAALTTSLGFLVMMGVEMGWLVLTRLRELKVGGENRYRFLLMFITYWLYTVYAPPSFLPPSSSGTLPILEHGPRDRWTTGTALVPAIVGTYIINVALSLLFGSRQLCSVTCSASYMWQGTFYDALKLSRLNLTRRRRGLVRVVRLVNGALIYAVLGLFAVLSYLDSVGLTRFYIGGQDPLVFLYLLLFGVVCYMLFIMAPLLYV